MFEKLKRLVGSQIGGFLATWRSQGLSKAISSAPIYFFRKLVRQEVLEPITNTQTKLNISEACEKIVDDFGVITLSDYIVNSVSISCIPPYLLNGFRVSLMGGLYRTLGNKDPFNANQIFEDFVSGVGKAWFIERCVNTLAPINAPASLPILIAGGVLGECLLYAFKKSFKLEEARQGHDALSVTYRIQATQGL